MFLNHLTNSLQNDMLNDINNSYLLIDNISEFAIAFLSSVASRDKDLESSDCMIISSCSIFSSVVCKNELKNKTNQTNKKKKKKKS